MTIKKPTPPAVGDGAPGEFDNTTPATPTPGKMSDRDIASKMGAAYGVDPVDLGSGFLAPPPMGPALDEDDIPDYLRVSSTQPIVDPLTKCLSCRHGHVTITMADAPNLDETGERPRPYVGFHGRCLVGRVDYDLDGLAPVFCTLYEQRAVRPDELVEMIKWLPDHRKPLWHNVHNKKEDSGG